MFSNLVSSNVPASAATYNGCVDPTWGFYLLEELNKLHKLPKIIRIAELSYSKQVQESYWQGLEKRLSSEA